jgi:uroporphyrinogen-III decarboxylase
VGSIRNFECTYGNAPGISLEITSALDLEFPDAYKNRESMAELARAIKAHDGAGMCLLPFCRTVEIEAMGATINYGDASAGPRAQEPCCETVEQILELPEIDYSCGRIREVLEACRLLKESGERVSLEIVGPWTQMQSLMDVRTLFRTQRKQPELVLAAMNKIGAELLRYVDEARLAGVDIITYSDSAGTLNILGPRLLEWTCREFVAPFLQELQEHLGEDMVVQVCPKFAYALLDCGLAHEEVHDLGHRVDFVDAIFELRHDINMVGQACIKNIGVAIEDGKIKELIIA